MNGAGRWIAGLVVVAGTVGASFAGSGLVQMGIAGGPSRSIGYDLGRLPGERGHALTVIAATSYPERLHWHHPRDRTQDWVQYVEDPARAGFIAWRGVRRLLGDAEGLAVFGLRDDEETSSVRVTAFGSSFAEDRAEIFLPAPLVRPEGARRARPLETRFGEIDRTLLSSRPDRDAETAAAVGVLRVRVLSTARRTGRGEWTLTWSVENRAGNDYAFSWPSVLTDGGEAWTGMVAAGDTATLERTVIGGPRILFGPVSLTRPGSVHPDYRGPASGYVPAD